MFETRVYVDRREKLKKIVKSGLLLFLGNEESPMNYADNTYPFRQDSTFLYYWGLNSAGLAALIDLDENREMIFGYDFTVDDIVWMGPQPTLKDRAQKVGVKLTGSLADLDVEMEKAVRQGRRVHFIPQYRPENLLKLESLLGLHPRVANSYASPELIKAVVAQRSVKSDEEIAEIESALDISYETQTLAMRKTRPGMIEREIAGAMAGLALSIGEGNSFPTIFSIHGETLHNHFHHNEMMAGDMVVNDSGVESLRHYASDITRTFPVSGKFSDSQKEIYEIVLQSQMKSIEAIRPGVKYRDVHLQCARVIADGLKALGFMKGDMQEAVEQGAHALFFPHGLGHMLGLDVHDMENLGEDFVGYDAETKRSDQFGLRSLRLAKALQPGYVLTVEPGIYFIPELIDMWKADGKFTEFIDYGQVEKYKKFGGIRIEDDVLVTDTGHRVLGKPIPKTVQDVEGLASQ